MVTNRTLRNLVLVGIIMMGPLLLPKPMLRADCQQQCAEQAQQCYQSCDPICESCGITYPNCPQCTQCNEACDATYEACIAQCGS